MKNNWRTVQLPAPLVEQVEKKLKQKNSTHTGISDYITDKVRRSLEEEP